MLTARLARVLQARSRLAPFHGLILLFSALGLPACKSEAANVPGALDAGVNGCVTMTLCDAGPDAQQTPGQEAGVIEAGTDDADVAVDADVSDAGHSEPHVCTPRNLQVAPRPVDVMFAVSGSDVMSADWATVRDALEGFAAAHPETRVGVHVYWGAQGDALTSGCEPMQEALLAPETYVAGRITNGLGASPPTEQSTGSPLSVLLDRYLDDSVPGLQPQHDTLLVPITNQSDGCLGVIATEDVRYVLASRIATDLQRKHVRTLPIALGSRAQTAADLTGLARSGGTGRNAPLTADDATSLAAALQVVHEQLSSCRFTFSGQAGAFPSEVSVRVAGDSVSRDPTQTNGWDFESEDLSQGVLFGDACAARRDGKVVTASIECQASACTEELLVAQRQARSVYVALDASGSMGSPNALDLTTWRRNQAAAEMARMLAAPSFETAKFALDLYSTGDENVCGTESVEVASSHLLNLLRQIDGTAPTGGASPGKAMQAASLHAPLLDADGTKTLLLIGDGPDSCLQGQALSDALQSTAVLAAKGVTSYAVRFAPDTDDAQAAQYDQVAALGGTSLHRQASDAIELRTVLGMVSNELTSCTLFTTRTLSADELARSRVYFGNRELSLGVDYSWSKDTSDGLVLAGNACTQLKETYLAAAHLELACE